MIQKTKKAWLITWEWIGDHAQMRPKIIGIISGKRGQSKICVLVEELWISKQAWYEQIAYAKKRSNSSYPAEAVSNFEGHVTCGHNPWIEARLVYDLEAYIDDEGVEYLQGKYCNLSLSESGKVVSQYVPFQFKR